MRWLTQTLLYYLLSTLSTIASLTASSEIDTIDPLRSIEIQNANETQYKVLSRRKRFLVFPDGSSIQIVFETQNHGYLQVGNIVWFSNTAALAWELPKDPSIWQLFKSHGEDVKPLRREDVQRHIYYLDEKGKLINKVPYTKKFIVPVFGKRSVDNALFQPAMNDSVVKQMHKEQTEREKFKSMDWTDQSIQFHRNGRTEFYGKLEKYLKSLGWKGKGCVLKLLCEAGKSNKSQGTFVDEIIRAVFTLPRTQQYNSMEHLEYDQAHNSSGDCKEQYPDCTQTPQGLPLQFLSN